MNTKAIKAAKNAYARVNGVAPQSGSKEEQRMLQALETVWKYEEPYVGETEEGVLTRLSMDSPTNGEPGELASYFRELRPSEFRGSSIWDIIFMMQNELEKQQCPDGLEKTNIHKTSINENPEEKEIGRMDENSVFNDAEFSSDKKSNNLEEAIKMEQTVLDRENADLEKKGYDFLFGDGSSKESKTAQPEENNTINSLNAAQKVIEESRQQREIVSRRTRIDKLILARPNAAEVYVDGEEAQGICSDPERALRKFKEITGCSEDVNTGTVKFSNVQETEVEINAAKEVYTALKEAIVDPEKQFKAYISKASGTLKGFRYTDLQNVRRIMKPDKFLEYLLDNSAGFIFIDETAQTQVALRRLNKNKEKSTKPSTGVKKTQDEPKKNWYSGIVSLKIYNRQAAIEDNSEYFKEIDREKVIDTESNGKSELSVRYKAKGKDNQQVIRTWRIPLKVRQYALVIKDAELENEFGTSRDNVIYSFDSPEKLKTLQGILSEAITKAAELNIALDSTSKVKHEVARQEEMKADTVAEDMADVAI